MANNHRLACWEEPVEPQALNVAMYRQWKHRILRHRENVQTARCCTNLVQYEKEVTDLEKLFSSHQRVRKFRRNEEEADVRKNNARLVQKLCDVAKESERRQVKLAAGTGPANNGRKHIPLARQQRQCAIDEENLRMLKRLHNVKVSVPTAVQTARSYDQHVALSAQVSRVRRPIHSPRNQHTPRRQHFKRRSDQKEPSRCVPRTSKDHQAVQERVASPRKGTQPPNKMERKSLSQRRSQESPIKPIHIPVASPTCVLFGTNLVPSQELLEASIKPSQKQVEEVQSVEKEEEIEESFESLSDADEDKKSEKSHKSSRSEISDKVPSGGSSEKSYTGRQSAASDRASSRGSSRRSSKSRRSAVSDHDSSVGSSRRSSASRHSAVPNHVTSRQSSREPSDHVSSASSSRKNSKNRQSADPEHASPRQSSVRRAPDHVSSAGSSRQSSKGKRSEVSEHVPSRGSSTRSSKSQSSQVPPKHGDNDNHDLSHENLQAPLEERQRSQSDVVVDDVAVEELRTSPQPSLQYEQIVVTETLVKDSSLEGVENAVSEACPEEPWRSSQNVRAHSEELENPTYNTSNTLVRGSEKRNLPKEGNEHIPDCANEDVLVKTSYSNESKTEALTGNSEFAPPFDVQTDGTSKVAVHRESLQTEISEGVEEATCDDNDQTSETSAPLSVLVDSVHLQQDDTVLAASEMQTITANIVQSSDCIRSEQDDDVVVASKMQPMTTTIAQSSNLPSTRQEVTPYAVAMVSQTGPEAPSEVDESMQSRHSTKSESERASEEGIHSKRHDMVSAVPNASLETRVAETSMAPEVDEAVLLPSTQSVAMSDKALDKNTPTQQAGFESIEPMHVQDSKSGQSVGSEEDFEDISDNRDAMSESGQSVSNPVGVSKEDEKVDNTRGRTSEQQWDSHCFSLEPPAHPEVTSDQVEIQEVDPRGKEETEDIEPILNRLATKVQDEQQRESQEEGQDVVEESFEDDFEEEEVEDEEDEDAEDKVS